MVGFLLNGLNPYLNLNFWFPGFLLFLLLFHDVLFYHQCKFFRYICTINRFSQMQIQHTGAVECILIKSDSIQQRILAPSSARSLFPPSRQDMHSHSLSFSFSHHRKVYVQWGKTNEKHFTFYVHACNLYICICDRVYIRIYMYINIICIHMQTMFELR